MMNNERFEERCISYLYDEMSDEERREFQDLLATDRDCNLKFNAIRKAKMMLGNLPRVEPGGEVRIESPERQAQSVLNEAKSANASSSATSAGSASSASAEGGTPHSPESAKPSSAGVQAPRRSTSASPAASSSTSSTSPPPLGIFPGSLTGRVISAAAAVLFGLLIFGAISGLQVRWDSDGFAMSMSIFGESGNIDKTPPPPTYLLQDEILEQLRSQQEELFSEIMAAEREQQRVMLLETLSEYAEAIETRRMIDMQLIGHELADFQQQTNHQLSQTDRIIYQLIETLSYNQELQDEQQ